MELDLTKLTPGQIALLTGIATVIASTVGATAALVAALINAWNARHIAKLTAYRDFRLKLFQPYLDALHQEVQVVRGSLTELVTVDIHTVGQGLSHERQLRNRKKVVKLWQVLRPKAEHFEQLNAAMTAFAVASDTLDDFLDTFERAIEKQDNHMNWFAMEGGSELKKRYIAAMKDVVIAGFEVQYAVEKWLFSI